MSKWIGLCFLLRCSALKLNSFGAQPSDSSESVDSLVQKALQAPDCSSDQLPPLAFVIHGVGACENASKLLASLNAGGAQVVFLNGCANQKALPNHVKSVEVGPNMPEHEAFNVGMDHVNDANAIVCLLRDDELPSDPPDNTVDLWKSHAQFLFGENSNLGSLACSHGFIDVGMTRSGVMGDDLSPKSYNENPETRTGDDCCDKYGCGSTEEVYPRLTHRDHEDAYNAARRGNFLKRRFAYLAPGWSASTQWVRKSAWKALGGFNANVQDKANPFFELEFQYKLYFNGFAFGQYDCEVRSSLLQSPPTEREMWTLSTRFNRSRLSSRYMSEFLKSREASNNKLLSLPMVSSYNKLQSDSLLDEGRALQHYDFQWHSSLLKMVDRANERLDMKYIMNKFPFRFRYHRPNLASLESSLPTLSDPTGEKVTLITMSYKHGNLNGLRDKLLQTILEPASGFATIVDKVILVWNGDISEVPPDFQEFISNQQAAFPVEIVPFAMNTLLNRYDTSLQQRINTQAVAFFDDDDAAPSLEELQLSFSFWRCDVRRATYLEGRMPRRPEEDWDLDAFDYMSNTARSFSQFGVPYGSVVSKKWLSVYMSPEFRGVQKFVIGHACKPDDIAFGLMIQFMNRFNGAAPTVVPRVAGRIRKSDNEKNKEQLSAEGMAGSPRWTVWRRESYVYLKKFFASFDANWKPNVEECYPHRVTDDCLWEIEKTDAQNMLRRLAKECPVI